jgi:hypothetical protein
MQSYRTSFQESNMFTVKTWIQNFVWKKLAFVREHFDSCQKSTRIRNTSRRSAKAGWDGKLFSFIRKLDVVAWNTEVVAELEHSQDRPESSKTQKCSWIWDRLKLAWLWSVGPVPRLFVQSGRITFFPVPVLQTFTTGRRIAFLLFPTSIIWVYHHCQHNLHHSSLHNFPVFMSGFTITSTASFITDLDCWTPQNWSC